VVLLEYPRRVIRVESIKKKKNQINYLENLLLRSNHTEIGSYFDLVSLFLILSMKQKNNFKHLISIKTYCMNVT